MRKLSTYWGRRSGSLRLQLRNVSIYGERGGPRFATSFREAEYWKHKKNKMLARGGRFGKQFDPVVLA